MICIHVPLHMYYNYSVSCRGRAGVASGRGRDLILGDDVLLYIAYVMLIWAAPIPATRCHCSLWP